MAGRGAPWVACGLSFLAAIGSVGCSLAVDVDSLSAGQTAADCGAREKLCPALGKAEEVRACVDSTSPQHGCDTGSCAPCEVAFAVPRCTQAGECGVAICLEGYDDCDRNESTGCEAQLLLDEANCGSCGHACEIDDGVANCVEGECRVVFCSPPFANCDDATDCETNTDDSAEHCGGCNQPCDGTCSGGACAP